MQTKPFDEGADETRRKPMQKPLLSLIFFLLTLTFCLSAAAEEPARAFLNGLRSRGYHDTALDYLKAMETSPLAPPELRQTIPYETALTLIDSSRTQRDMEVRYQQLDQAQELLNQFIGTQGSHPKARAAQSQLGNLIVERARIKVEQSKSGKAKQLLKEANKLYADAFKNFTSLQTSLEKELEKIPKVLDTSDREQAALAQRRTQLRADNLQTELLAAAIREEMADTVDEGSKQGKAYLSEAAERYDSIYKKYRSRLAGLYARMYQGRCNQRLGKTKDALGYYGELLDQPDTPESFRVLKTKTLVLAMECWLAPNERKYVEAIKRASNWLVSAPRTSEREPDMLAIRLSLARAYKMQADDYESREPRDNRTIKVSIETAKKHAKAVADEPGKLQEEAQQLVVSLGGRLVEAVDSGPATFTAAQLAAKKSLDAIAPASAKVAKIQREFNRAKGASREKLKQDLDTAKEELATIQDSAVDLYRLAMRLADQDTPPSELNLVRYFVCYLHYLRQQYFEAALVGDLVSSRYPESAGAQQCAKISLASYMKILETNEAASTDFEIDRLSKVADVIVDTWPDTDLAVEALSTLVPVMVNADQLDQAKRMTLALPKSSPSRGEAEFVTGQAMWGKHLRLQQQLAAGKKNPSNEDIDPKQRQTLSGDLAASAIEMLASGFKLMPKEPLVSTSNATALLSLAQAYVASNQHSEAVDVLEHPVLGPVTLVNANHESVQNPVFAEETYRTALQAYVGSIGVRGTSMMEKAKTAMAAMQEAVGSDAAGKQRMLGVYVNLARNVETQMKSAAPDAKQEMSVVFEAFLQELSAGSSDIGVLNWVAETFASLGSGFDEDPDLVNENARKYYVRSIQAFQILLSRPELQPQLATQIQARMASVKGQIQDYEGALSDLKVILAKSPNALNLQVQAAELLQQWGRIDPQKYELAIGGIPAEGTGNGAVWGWGKIANTAMRYEQFRDNFFQARYQMAQCQLSLAGSKQGADKAKLISSAKRNLTMTKQLYPTLGGETWTTKYDALIKSAEATP